MMQDCSMDDFAKQKGKICQVKYLLVGFSSLTEGRT